MAESELIAKEVGSLRSCGSARASLLGIPSLHLDPAAGSACRFQAGWLASGYLACQQTAQAWAPPAIDGSNFDKFASTQTCLCF